MASEDIGALVVRIESNLKNFNDGINKASDKVDGFGSNVKKLGGLIAGAFTVGAIVSFSKKLVTTASDAAEMQSKFNTVFSSMSNDAEAWAAKFRDNVGGSRVEIKGMLADSQDLLTGFGATTDQAFDFSTKIQSLGTDLASFQNVSGGAEEAVDRLRKGLMGEHENLKAMGIVINETIMSQELASRGDKRKVQDLSEIEKIQLRYTIAVKQSKNAIGDAEKTAGGFANQMRNLKGQLTDAAAKLGEKLLPAATTVVTWLNEKLPVMQAVASEAFTQIGSVIGPIYKTVMPLLRQGFEYFSTTIIPAFSAAFKFWMDNIYPIIVDAFNFITTTILPPLVKIFQFIANEVVPILAAKFQEWMPVIADIMKGLWDVIKVVLGLLVKGFEAAWPYIKVIVVTAVDILGAAIGGLLRVLRGVINFVAGVFTGDWARAWGGIKDIFGGIWGALTGIAKGALNGLISLINLGIGKLNKLKLSIPDWVPLIGGKSFSLNIPEIPKLAIGTNFVPFDTAAFIHKGEAVVPADNNPSNPNAKNPIGGEGINFEGMFKGAIFNVRSDQDAKLIAREIWNLQQNKARASGVVYP